MEHILRILLLLTVYCFYTTECKICASNLEDSYQNIPTKQALANLKQKLEGCTRIIGTLVFNGLKDDYGSPIPRTDLDFSFLNSIEEIFGTLIIRDSCVSNISLPNLKIIKGNVDSTNMVERAPILIYNQSPITCTQSTIIDLRNLRYIGGKEPVNILQASSCYLNYRINFEELYEVGKFSPLKYANNPCNVTKGNMLELNYPCHESCPVWSDKKKYCWGPLADQCQVQTKCKDKEATGSCYTGYCYSDNYGHEQCCNEQCIGGCNGSSSRQCFGCRHFDQEGVCVTSCSNKVFYDPKKMEVSEKNITRYLPLGGICVQKCLASFYEQEETCVRKCGTGYKVEMDKCVKHSDPDTRICYPNNKDSLFCSVNNTFMELDKKPCSEYHGTISILDFCFDPKYQEMKPILYKLITIPQLYQIFGKLKAVYGEINIMLTKPGITNLTFFSSLEKIELSSGSVPQEDTPKTSLQVISPYINFFGTNQLRKAVTGFLFASSGKEIYNNNSLISFCGQFFPTRVALNDKLIEVQIFGPTDLFYNRILTKIISGFYIDNSCPYKGKSCNSLCDSKYGCWGPTANDCVRCTGFVIDNECISSCSNRTGWYYNQTTGLVRLGGSDFTNRQCSRCHPLCKRCTGVTLEECTECLHVKEDGLCRHTCSYNRYNDSDNVCQPCAEHCSRSGNLRLCNGPEPFATPNGCTMCNKIMPIAKSVSDSSEILKCLKPDEDCPEGYYGRFAPDILIKYPTIFNISKTHGNNVLICLKCNDRCRVCSETSDKCLKCKHYTYVLPASVPPIQKDSKDCKECQYCTKDSNVLDKNLCKDSYLPRPQNYYPDNTTRQCLPCHDACNGCLGSGNSNCTDCSPNYFRMLYPEPTSKYVMSCSIKCEEPLKSGTSKIDNRLVCATEEQFAELSKTHELQQVNTDKSNKEAAVIAGMVIVGAITVIIILGVFCYWWREKVNAKKRYDENEFEYDEEIEPLRPTSAEPNMAHLRVIKENELIKGPEIGAGAFGTVYKGDWLSTDGHGTSHRIHVAIKILNDSDSSVNSELLEETKIMASADHPNVVRIVGICLTQQIQLISQYMPLGNLRDFLRSKKDTTCIGSSHLLRYAVQIASGMNYLEGKNIIHRDLACRNVLVQSLKCVKITDFGLARLLDSPGEEYKASGGKLPVKWLALECLVSRKFSHKSDVWAFGVTLWEIFMFGDAPYPNVRPRDLADYLEKGERLAQPPICTLDIYMLMIKCWMLNEAHRPSFAEIEMEFKKYASDPGRYVFIKGDKYARNPSNESNKAEDESRKNSERVSAARDTPIDEYLNSTLGGSDSDNEVFRHDDQAATSTLPLRTFKSRPVVLTPSFNGATSQSKGKGKHFSIGKKKDMNLSDEQIINKYTSDPCKIHDRQLPDLPAPPPPLPPNYPTLRFGSPATSPTSINNANGGTTSSESDEDYLKPRTRAMQRHPHPQYLGLNYIPVKPNESVKPKPNSDTSDSSPLITSSPSPIATPLVQNPEYFFNNSRHQYENSIPKTPEEIWQPTKLLISPDKTNGSLNHHMSDSQV